MKIGIGKFWSVTTSDGKTQYHQALNCVFSSSSLYRQASSSRKSKPCFREISSPPFQTAPASVWMHWVSSRSIAPPMNKSWYWALRQDRNVQVRNSDSGSIVISSSMTRMCVMCRCCFTRLISIMPRVNPPAPPTFLFCTMWMFSLLNAGTSKVWALSETKTSSLPCKKESGFSKNRSFSSFKFFSMNRSRL